MTPVSQAAAQRRHQTVVAARNVLSSPGLRELLSERQRAALQARVEHPEATYAELAPTIGVNFSTCAYLVEKALTRTGGLPGGKKARRSHLTLARLVPQGASPASLRQDRVSAAKRVLADPALAELLTPRQRVALDALVRHPQAKACGLATALGYQSVHTYNATVMRGIRLAALSPSEIEVEIATRRDRRRGDPEALKAANADRSHVGAQRQVDAASKALRAASARRLLSPREIGVLEARVAHPRASLAELAEILGCTKDTCSGLLRRALRKTTKPTGLSEANRTTGVAA